MFSLIIALVSTALVAVLSLATVYYGGSALTEYGRGAHASRLLNEASQLEVAMQIYRADHEGEPPTSLSSLTQDGKYLKGLAPTWVDNLSYVTTQGTDIPDDVCLEFNNRKGVPYIPSCTDPSYLQTVICCIDPE